jgi:asparagine synthase (glutamine-hydrolysing)
MCGICGIAASTTSNETDERTLEAMRASLAHRGPDGSGVYRHGGVGFVHTRLSIIDVGGGKQPLSNEDGSVWITFNGEIYNYRELRGELIARGHQFRTQSDTEVLVHLYEEEGTAMVHRLHGMFAFAIHDQREDIVFLARDHFGIKPLFYAVADGTMAFGSEIKAVLAAFSAKAGTTTEAVQEYLLFRAIGDDRTFFRDVKRLRPGSSAVWKQGRLTTLRYWSPPAPVPDEAMTLGSAVDRLETWLEEAVRSQMMSDVPLGTFCSGGVDSGLTSHYAARHASGHLHTFSVGFKEAAWDESALARDTAKRIGSEHHVFWADPEAFLAALPDLIWNHDEPLGHANSVLIALLSRYARQYVTVVLTGEGSDELFGGYPRHHVVGLAARLRALPDFAERLVRLSFAHFGGRKGRLIANTSEVSALEAIVLNSSMLPRPLVSALTGNDCATVIYQRLGEAERLSVPEDPVASISRYDQRYYLPALLDRMDRMTMAHGLEGRVPFLDVRLAEWASTVPSRLKLGVLENKRVVKALADRHLSPKVVRGPKSGFGVPFGDWLRDATWQSLADRLLDRNHAAGALIDTALVSRMAGRHLQGAEDHGDALWQLANIYLWYETKFVA